MTHSPDTKTLTTLHAISRLGGRLGKIIAWAGLLVIALAGCAENPVTGNSDFVLLGEDQELAMGKEGHGQVLKQYGVYDNSALQDYVGRVGKKLAANSHRTDLIYRFEIIDSAEVNAFALPGGYIYITRGLLAHLNSEAELAAVLGHEIGHVTARHSVRQYTAQQAAGIGFTLGSILFPQLRTAGVQDVYSLLGGALISGYGRDHELEADRLGAQYLARTGYDPDAMLKVIRVLKSQELFEKKRANQEDRPANVYHGLFATHPDHDERLKEVIGEASQFKASASSFTGRDEFLHAINGLTYGTSASQGVFRANRFYHQGLGIGMEFPLGWRLENRPAQLVATPPDNDAFFQISIQDLNKRTDPEDFMRNGLRLHDLQDGREFTANGLSGYTALTWTDTPFGRRLTRFSVVFHGDRAYIFAGARKDANDQLRYRSQFLDTSMSLHPLTAAEKKLAQEHRLRVLRASPETRFVDLARQSPLESYPEAYLRLINALYPAGEPTPGALFKLIE